MKKLRFETKVALSAIKAVFGRWSTAATIVRWARVNAGCAAIAIIAIVFMVQMAVTWDRSLNPDEALIFTLINVKGPIEAYRSAVADPHPPLFFMLLYLWTRIGHSEPFLRILPAAFGAVFLWFMYQWASSVFGKASGILTLVVLASSPAWLSLSAEVRNYSLTLMLSAAALAEFERSGEAKSGKSVLRSSLFLYLAILSHYSALFIVLPLAVYEWIRLRKSGASRRLISVWVGSQVGIVALYVTLYFIQVKDLIRSGRGAAAQAGWLTAGYFQPDRETPARFVARQTWEVGRYFFGSAAMTTIAVILVAAGVVILAIKKPPVAVLIMLPCLLGITAGLLGWYPLIGTRHSIYLLLFASIAIGVALSALVAARRWAVLLALAVLVSFCWTTPAWATAPRSLSQINSAVDRLQKRAPAGSVLFADGHTRAILSYYLFRNDLDGEGPGLGRFRESNAEMYSVVGSPMWIADPKSLGNEVERLFRTYRLPGGQRLWVVSLDPEYDPVAVLARRLPNAYFPTAIRSGRLWIIEMCLVDELEPPLLWVDPATRPRSR